MPLRRLLHAAQQAVARLRHCKPLAQPPCPADVHVPLACLSTPHLQAVQAKAGEVSQAAGEKAEGAKESAQRAAGAVQERAGEAAESGGSSVSAVAALVLLGDTC